MAKQDRKTRKQAAEAVAEVTPEAVEELSETDAGDAEPVTEAGAGEGEWVQEVESSYLQSKYTWVSVAAKRARELLEGSKPRVESLSEKPVTVALEELAQGKLYFERVQDSRR